MPKHAVAGFALLLSGPALAAPPPAPKLIVAIAVDQFSADLYGEYRGVFTDGMKRLGSGVVFPQGYQSHAATETCPGHSTMLTGSRPARTGIIANTWFDQSIARADKAVYCAEDESAPGSSAKDYVASVGHLKVPTLGDRMKVVTPASRVVAVAGKDRAALMMGGHNTDQLWFWAGKSFVTLADRTAPPPATVTRVNSLVENQLARPAKIALPPVCAGRSVAVPLGERSVGTLPEVKAGDAGAFRMSPSFDADVADLAIGLLDEMKLGRGAATDLLTVSFSATDYVGHGRGTEGAEMCTQLIALDHSVGRLLTALDKSGVPYVVELTADHGGHDLPERNTARGIADAQRVERALAPSELAKVLAAEFPALKDIKPLLYGDGAFGDFYLSKAVPATIRPQVLSSLRAKLLAHDQVAEVLTAEELRKMAMPQPPVDEWSLAERARASFDADRSGDLVVLLKPHVTPISDTKGSVATHGSPWNYDRRVPILFWWPGATAFEQPLPTETVDILPTLAALIKLPVPAEEIDGHCLDLDAGAGTTCPVK
ncbi:alkaline phosphatase family protein [Sphingomonas naphthae]|uniref:Alkaline phosphatase n=1 Tax=Sphingomonas naphthae TaxID=1813468 RepID=A0ABY7TGY7_9SPHN|nr:alkaline phosphatase family protein [Sphingomonas naphthae]WCT72496.1 alkaline phosphatase family protein [Sphingomonas naphthae]